METIVDNQPNTNQALAQVFNTRNQIDQFKRQFTTDQISEIMTRIKNRHQFHLTRVRQRRMTFSIEEASRQHKPKFKVSAINRVNLSPIVPSYNRMNQTQNSSPTETLKPLEEFNQREISRIKMEKIGITQLQLNKKYQETQSRYLKGVYLDVLSLPMTALSKTQRKTKTLNNPQKFQRNFDFVPYVEPTITNFLQREEAKLIQQRSGGKQRSKPQLDSVSELSSRRYFKDFQKKMSSNQSMAIRDESEQQFENKISNVIDNQSVEEVNQYQTYLRKGRNSCLNQTSRTAVSIQDEIVRYPDILKDIKFKVKNKVKKGPFQNTTELKFRKLAKLISNEDLALDDIVDVGQDGQRLQ